MTDKMKITVRDVKQGRMYTARQPIDYDDLIEDEQRTLNQMAGIDPHFWGPGYGEE